MEQDGSSVEADLPITQQPVPASFGDIGGPGGLIDLRPGHSAAFFLVWEDVPTGSGRCPQASGFDFRTPHPRTSDSNKLVKFSFQPCGKSFEVSQMQPPSVKY
jgi:hypothetical protein